MTEAELGALQREESFNGHKYHQISFQTIKFIHLSNLTLSSAKLIQKGANGYYQN